VTHLSSPAPRRPAQVVLCENTVDNSPMSERRDAVGWGVIWFAIAGVEAIRKAAQ
jgi:hypothetical protein